MIAAIAAIVMAAIFLQNVGRLLKSSRQCSTTKTIVFKLKDEQLSVPLTADNNIPDDTMQKVLSFQPFVDWKDQLEKEMEKSGDRNIKSINIQSVDMFGPKKMGFVKFRANFEEDGKSADKFVFMRGGSVAILILLNVIGKTGKVDSVKTILTVQKRIPIPAFNFPEIPAGMLDGSGEFTGVAAKEIEEETGIVIKENELKDLTELTYGPSWRGVYPSAGGSDEFLRMFVCEKTISTEECEAMKDKVTGLAEENEHITLRIVDFEDAWTIAPDSKLLSCLALYDRLKKRGDL